MRRILGCRLGTLRGHFSPGHHWCHLTSFGVLIDVQLRMSRQRSCPGLPPCRTTACLFSAPREKGRFGSPISTPVPIIMASTSTFDYVIVGAGVFGLTAAIELKSRQNDARICVLDPGPVPHRHAASTDVSKVIRMDYGGDELYVEMMEESFPIWKRWNDEWKEQVYFESGLVGVFDSLEAGTFEARTVDTLKKRGHKIETFEKASDFRARFPAWKQDHVGYFNPVAGWARSGRVVEHLNRIAVAAGINVQYGSMNKLLLKPTASSSNSSPTSVCEGLVTTDGQELRAKTVIVAAGASTPMLIPQVKHLMWPTAQTVFHIEIEEPSQFPVEQFPVFFSSIASTGFYGFPIIEERLTTKLAPRKDIAPGVKALPADPSRPQFRLKIGQHGPGHKLDTITDTSVDNLWSQIEASEEKKFRSWLNIALPQLAKSKIVYTRICMYCDTFDGDFLIDHVPSISGLVVASGGSGHGFKFTPILGSIIADVVQKKPNKFKSRFAWRDLSLGRKESSRYLNKEPMPQTLASL